MLIASLMVVASDQTTISRASFEQDGTVKLPVGYRHWSHVGTSIKSSGINVLDLSPVKSPVALDAYVEPSAIASFQKTGKWPDGTQIVKEYSDIRSGNGCDQKTLVCETSFGKSISESGYDGLAMMIKDSKRFRDAPGNWAYLSFGRKPPPYNSTAQALPRERCEFCHQRLASDTDYVVSRAHLGLAP